MESRRERESRGEKVGERERDIRGGRESRGEREGE